MFWHFLGRDGVEVQVPVPAARYHFSAGYAGRDAGDGTGMTKKGVQFSTTSRFGRGDVWLERGNGEYVDGSVHSSSRKEDVIAR